MAKQPTVLVTGATGFLGGFVARRLINEGCIVKALVRAPSKAVELHRVGVEIVVGDLRDAVAVQSAIAGVDIVVHAGAGTSGATEESTDTTVLGTRNVVTACRASDVSKLVYISSCSVYETQGFQANTLVTEEFQLERFPKRRGSYSAAKLEAEEIVTRTIGRGLPRTVILRLGVLYGPGANPIVGMLGLLVAQRFLLVFGNGHSMLPLIHVDNAVDAIFECIRSPGADNQIFNVVDSDQVTKNEYISRVVTLLNPGAKVIHFPMSLLLALAWAMERVASCFGKEPPLSVYRLLSSQKPVRYSTAKIARAIGWSSRLTFRQATDQLACENSDAPSSVS